MRGVEMNGANPVTVKEGLARLVLPDDRLKGHKGPAKKVPVFFNPAMEFCRDVTVALIPLLQERQRRRILDGLGATGVRGIRIAIENDGMYDEIVINDINPKAFSAIKVNIRQNKVHDVNATNRHLNSLMHEDSFNYIDIDPYGTPVPFLDSAVQAVGRGVLGITATDTAALCGSSKDACLRRYGARAQRSHFMHEAGLRILIGFVVQLAARYDKAATPLLSHANDHYMRTYISMEKGARKARSSLEKIGHSTLFEDGRIETVSMEDVPLDQGPASRVKQGRREWGPLWTGPLHDIGVLERIKIPATIGRRGLFSKTLDLWKGEAEFGPLFYDVDELSRRVRASPPKMARLLQAIVEKGYNGARTQFSPKGFKTDMPFEELVPLMASL